MNRILISFLLILSATSIHSQCNEKLYQKFLADGNAFSILKKYKPAIDKYSAAKEMCEEKADYIDGLIATLFNKINKEREDALAISKTNNNFKDYVGFNKNLAGWAYKDGSFAVIDINGNLKTEFIYDNPNPFNNNIALAQSSYNYVFLDNLGKERSDKFWMCIPTFSGRYYTDNALLNSTGEYICKFESDYNSKWVNGFRICKLDRNKEEISGILDSTGKILFTSEHTLNLIENGIFIIEDTTGKKGFGIQDTVIFGPVFNNLTYLEKGNFFYKNSVTDFGIIPIKQKAISFSGKYSSIHFLRLPQNMFNYYDYGNFIPESEFEPPHDSILKFPIVSVTDKIIKDELDRQSSKPINEKTKKNKRKKTKKAESVASDIVKSTTSTEPVNSNIITAENRKRYGILNSSGKELTKIEYDTILPLYDKNFVFKSYVKARKNNTWSIIKLPEDSSGVTEITKISDDNDSIGDFIFENSLIVKHRNKFKLFNLSKGFVTKQNYPFISFENDMINVWLEYSDTFLTSFISENGNDPNSIIKDADVVVPIPGSKGLKWLGTNFDNTTYRYSLIDQHDKLIPGTYDSIREKNGKKTYIHKIDTLYVYDNGCSLAKIQDSFFLFNASGYRMTVSNSFVNSKPVNTNYFITSENGFYGLVKVTNDNQLLTILNNQYTDDIKLINNYIKVRKLFVNKVFMYGLFDTTGYPILDFRFSKITILENGFINAEINSMNKTEFLTFDRAGNNVNQQFAYYPEDYFLAGNKRSYYNDLNYKTWYFHTNPLGNRISDKLYTWIGQMKNGYALAKNNEIRKIIDSTGNEVVLKHNDNNIDEGTRFQNNGTYNSGYFYIRIDNNRYIYIDNEGKILNNDTFDAATNFNQNQSIVRLRNKWYIYHVNGTKTPLNDFKGHKIINFTEFINGFSRFQILYSDTSLKAPELRFGFVNTKAEFLPDVFPFAYPFSEGKSAVYENKEWYFINSAGKPIFEKEKYIFASSFDHKNALVKLDNKLYLLNNDGIKTQLTCVPDATYNLMYKNWEFILSTLDSNINFSEIDTRFFSPHIPLMVVSNQSNKKSNLMDVNGKYVFDSFHYEQIDLIGKNFWLLSNNNRFGFYDAETKIVVKPIYNQIANFEKEVPYIRVKKNGMWGWIYKSGKEAIRCQYEYSTPFVNGKSWVKSKQIDGIFQINTNGEMILNSIKYDYTDYYEYIDSGPIPSTW